MGAVPIFVITFHSPSKISSEE